MQVKVNRLKELYDQDFNLWLEELIANIKSGNFASLDWENLVEELVSLGKQQKLELENRLIVLLEHLLKLIYWETERDYNARNLRGTIVEGRQQIWRLLQDNPSLKPYLAELFVSCYIDACDITAAKTGLEFPTQPGFTLEQVLDRSWFPVD